MLKCCGRVVKPKRFVFNDENGMQVLRLGRCNNPNCRTVVLELEGLSLFGRVKKTVLRGKRAENFLEENRARFMKEPSYRQYRKNTAKGFHYCNTFWDFKKNRIRIERRELATDRLVGREELDLREAG